MIEGLLMVASVLAVGPVAYFFARHRIFGKDERARVALLWAFPFFAVCVGCWYYRIEDSSGLLSSEFYKVLMFATFFAFVILFEILFRIWRKLDNPKMFQTVVIGFLYVPVTLIFVFSILLVERPRHEITPIFSSALIAAIDSGEYGESPNPFSLVKDDGSIRTPAEYRAMMDAAEAREAAKEVERLERRKEAARDLERKREKAYLNDQLVRKAGEDERKRLEALRK